MTGAHGSYDSETDFLWLLHVVTRNTKISVPVYLFWINSWSSIRVSSRPTNQPTDASRIRYGASVLCGGRTEGSQEDQMSFGHALLDVDAFSWLVCAQLCALELKCAKSVAYTHSRLHSSSLSRCKNKWSGPHFVLISSPNLPISSFPCGPCHLPVIACCRPSSFSQLFDAAGDVITLRGSSWPRYNSS